MISLIICSAREEVLKKAIENIGQTIGVAYEVIVINNPSGRFGICEAYNRGAAQALYDILCFMHEDIAFETHGWGRLVAKHLENKETGLIGVAGGDAKSMVPSSWPSYISENEMHLIQHYKSKDKPPQHILQTGAADQPALKTRVACIDGVWMCTRKDVFNKYRFDDTYLTKFHGYDIDYSLQVNKSYEVFVVFDVLLHHYSEGTFNKEWVLENIRLSEKWKHVLPFSVKELPKSELVRQHWTCMNIFISQMIELGYSRAFIISMASRFMFNRFFNFSHFVHSGKNILLKRIEK